MQDEGCGFGGVAGRVLAAALSLPNLIAAAALGFALLAGNRILVQIGVPLAVAAAVTLAAAALVPAHRALGGLAGRWAGTRSAQAGESWPRVVAVTARYLALTSLWLVPLALTFQFLATPAMDGGTPLAAPLAQYGPLLALPLVLGVLTAPLFLIAAVAARSFGELFVADLWRAHFSDRRADLLTIYAICIGVFGAFTLLALPLVLVAGSLGPTAALAVGALFVCPALGFSLDLLGRLCGHYAHGATLAVRPAVHARPAGYVPPAARLTPTAEFEEDRESAADRRPSIVALAAAHAGMGPAVEESPPLSDAAATVRLDRRATATPKTAVSVAARDCESTESVAVVRRPALLDAPARLEAVQRRATGDLDGAIATLLDMRSSFAPHPLVLHALALALYRCGRAAEAVTVAREALPLCFTLGHIQQAAEIFRGMREQRRELGLDCDQLLAIGSQLIELTDYGAAARAFSAVIALDANEPRAVKGLLGAAQKILHEKSRPEAAAKIYRFLLEHCATSPLAEIMRAGLDESERRAVAG